MKMTIRDYDYENKRVIIRCDLNVPIVDGNIIDDTRIFESLASLNYLIDHKAKVIVLSHLGKIKTEEDKHNNSLYPVYLKLKEYLNTNVYFSKETRGLGLEIAINNLRPGDVLLVENTRFEDYPNNLESNCDTDLSKYWASMGDIFINDAYGTCHRAHASNVGIAKVLPSGIGFLVEKEITKIDEVLNDNTHPFIAVMGGKKISDKIPVTNYLITQCDYLLIGGGMCFTFLKTLGYNVGKSIVDDDNLVYCNEFLDRYRDKVILPVDVVTQDGIVKDINDMSNDDIGYDIGPKTVQKFGEILKNSKRIIINGPMGIFEEKAYQNGTKGIYEVISNNGIKTLVGGGETAASVNMLGYKDKFYHVSTGGGATLEYLSGKKLPAIVIINNKLK